MLRLFYIGCFVLLWSPNDVKKGSKDKKQCPNQITLTNERYMNNGFRNTNKHRLYSSWLERPRLQFLLFLCLWMNVVKLLVETFLHMRVKVARSHHQSLPICQTSLKVCVQTIAPLMGDVSMGHVSARKGLQPKIVRYRFIKNQISSCKYLH